MTKSVILKLKEKRVFSGFRIQTLHLIFFGTLLSANQGFSQCDRLLSIQNDSVCFFRTYVGYDSVSQAISHYRNDSTNVGDTIIIVKYWENIANEKRTTLIKIFSDPTRDSVYIVLCEGINGKAVSIVEKTENEINSWRSTKLPVQPGEYACDKWSRDNRPSLNHHVVCIYYIRIGNDQYLLFSLTNLMLRYLQESFGPSSVPGCW